MAFAATVDWEVRSGGNDANGGGFDPVSGVPGTDYSQQDAAQVAYTDLVIDAVTNTDCTSALNPFTAAHVGNVVNITGGTGFTVQRVQIMSVTAGVATMDKSLGTLGSTGGTGNLGGAFASPGMAGSVHVAGNTIYVKQATYTVTTASINVASGVVSLTADTATRMSQIIGYDTNRAPGNTDTKPVIVADGVITTFTLITLANSTRLDNVEVNGNSRTSSRGVNCAFVCQVFRCVGKNCTNSAFSGSVGNLLVLCEATGCSTQPAILSCNCYGCVAHTNTVTGISINSQGVILSHCYSVNNSGASSQGFNVSTSVRVTCNSCVAYGNGQHGFNLAFSNPSRNECINCLSVSNGGYGYTGGGSNDMVWLYNCAGGFPNTSGNVNATPIPSNRQINFITLTADPFTNAAGLDFSLNNTAGGGALLRALGWPGSAAAYKLSGLSTNSYPDIGGAQHLESAGGGVSRSRVVNA